MEFSSFVVLDFIQRKTYGIKREIKLLIWFFQSNNSQLAKTVDDAQNCLSQTLTVFYPFVTF